MKLHSTPAVGAGRAALRRLVLAVASSGCSRSGAPPRPTTTAIRSRGHDDRATRPRSAPTAAASCWLRRSGPRRSTRIMANETSSTRRHRTACSSASPTSTTPRQQDIPLLAKSWELSAGRPDLDLPPAPRRRVLGRPSDHRRRRAVQLRRSPTTTTLHPSMQDLLKMNGKPFEVSAPDSVHRRDQDAASSMSLLLAVASVGAHHAQARARAGVSRRATSPRAYNIGTSPTASSPADRGGSSSTCRARRPC